MPSVDLSTLISLDRRTDKVWLWVRLTVEERVLGKERNRGDRCGERPLACLVESGNGERGFRGD